MKRDFLVYMLMPFAELLASWGRDFVFAGEDRQISSVLCGRRNSLKVMGSPLFAIY